MPGVCLQFVIVVFPDHTHLLFLALQRHAYFVIFLHNRPVLTEERTRFIIWLLMFMFIVYYYTRTVQILNKVQEMLNYVKLNCITSANLQ